MRLNIFIYIFLRFLFKDSQVLCYKKFVKNSTELLVSRIDHLQMIYATIIGKSFYRDGDRTCIELVLVQSTNRLVTAASK